MKWSAVAHSGQAPGPRSSHAACIVGDTLYLFGGELQPRIPVPNDVYACSLPDGTWSTLETTGSVPPPRTAPAAAVVGTDIYIFGGRTGVDMGEGSLNDLYKLDTQTLVWSKIDGCVGQPPPERSYHTMLASDGKLYIFGGCGASGRLNDLHSFDPRSCSWAALPASEHIVGRGGSSIAPSADGAQLFLVGGFCGRELNDAHAFDFGTNAWVCSERCASTDSSANASGSATETRLPARSVFGLCTHGCTGAAGVCGHAGHLLAFGGESDPSDKGHAGAGKFNNETWCCDTSGGWKWHRLEPSGQLPAPRGWFAATAWRGGLVVHGGLNNDNQRMDDLYVLDMH